MRQKAHSDQTITHTHLLTAIFLVTGTRTSLVSIITLIATRLNSDGSWESSFLTEHPPLDSAKTMTFIGHPRDRRLPAGRRTWKVPMRESASVHEDAVIWFDGKNSRTLTANEVLEYAQQRLHGFSCVDI